LKDDLLERGCLNLPSLSKQKCDNIVKQLEKLTFVARSCNHEIVGLDYESARSNVYDIKNQAGIASILEVDDLAKDTKILSIVREYLGCEPIQTQAACWWTVNYSEDEEARCAQMFHVDCTYDKFIKLFLYLNDITMENGPHVYVPGSINNMEHTPYTKKGGRVDDDYIKERYSEIKYMLGEKGTMNLVDTTGWHKGNPVVKGYRLLVQLEWTNNITDLITGKPLRYV